MAHAGEAAGDEPSGPERFLRPEVRALRGYVPGTQPEGEGWIKLNTNENPYAPSAAVIGAIALELGPALRLYPHPAAAELRQRAAEAYGVMPDQVFVANGSDDLLHQLVRAAVPPGGKIAAAEPCYGLYRVLASACGAEYVEVPLADDFGLPSADAWPAAPLYFLTNPNSPTGVAVPTPQVAQLARALDGLLVVDEAYADFAEDDCLRLVGELDNVVVARTFSKSFSLAGMRLGLGLGPPRIIAALDALKDAYNVNRLALAAGAAALADLPGMRANVNKVVATRERVRAELEAVGFEVYPSAANFLLIRVGPQAKALQQALVEQQILVRYLSHPRVADCLRVSIGTDYEMDVFLEAFVSLADSV